MRLLSPIVVLCAVAPLVAGQPAKTHLDFRREADAAYERKDYKAALAATAAALKLRPDSPRYRHRLAALSARTGDAAGALHYLRELAALGVAVPVQRDPDFASLQGRPEFLRLLQDFAANAEPRGAAEVVAELPGRTGILEGLAFRARTGDGFLSDVHHRCIWRRDREGRISRFTDEDEEFAGIFGLAIDEPRRTLWAAMAAVPEMAGFEPAMKGRAALADIDLERGELRQVFAVPADGREHGLGDVLLGPDGTVYASDSLAPVIWQLAPGAEELQKLVDSPLFGSLQGMALRDRTLLVADYTNGLFTIDLPSGEIRALPPPKDTTLLGIDGLVLLDDGLVAIQNGFSPQRVLRIKLAPRWDAVTEVTVLASGLAHLTDLTLATPINGRATVIAGAGWDDFDPQTHKAPRPHTVRLFQIERP